MQQCIHVDGWVSKIQEIQPSGHLFLVWDAWRTHFKSGTALLSGPQATKPGCVPLDETELHMPFIPPPPSVQCPTPPPLCPPSRTHNHSLSRNMLHCCRCCPRCRWDVVVTLGRQYVDRDGVEPAPPVGTFISVLSKQLVEHGSTKGAGRLLCDARTEAEGGACGHVPVHVEDTLVPLVPHVSVDTGSDFAALPATARAARVQVYALQSSVWHWKLAFAALFLVAVVMLWGLVQPLLQLGRSAPKHHEADAEVPHPHPPPLCRG